MTQLAVEMFADPRWLSIPLEPDIDVDSWAATSATQAFEVRETTPTEDELGLAAAVYAGLARNVQAAAADPEQPLEGAFALVAGENVFPVTVATARRLTAAGMSTDEIIGTLIAPADERYGEPDIDDFDTTAGTAYRVTQRMPVETEEGTQELHEWQAYLWHVEEAEAAVLLTVQFVDLIDAAVFDDSVRHLAEGVRISA
jgi:hypothetical protein